MDKRTLIIAICAATLLWVAVSAQQELFTKPGPGSGVTNVTGTVSIANIPNVRATQEGEWRVAVGNTPSVRVTEVPAPTFLRAGSRYEITWADGTTEAVSIGTIAPNGWIEVDSGRRWINLSTARAVSAAK